MKTNRPNVLLLFSDQHQAGVSGFENHPDVLTPNLDQLAAEGVRFSRAYCQDGVCVPSRASFFTGLYPRTLGCMDNNYFGTVMKEVVSLPAAFQGNGYRTAAFGKRHLFFDCDAGWDIEASHLVKESPGDNYVRWIQDQGYGDAFDQDWAAEFGRGAEGTPSHEREIPFALMSVRESKLPEDMTMEAWTKRRTIDFLRSRQPGDQPFFCFSSFYRPHQPYTPQPGYFRRFDRSRWGTGRRAGKGIAMPATLRQPAGELPPMLQEQHRGMNRVWRFDLARQDEQLYRDAIAAYYALVEEIDDHVGAILHALDETGQRDNTIVIYASDHGDFVGAHGMIEKCSSGHNVYEETLRVPLIFRWPDVVKGPRTCAGLAELVDVFPTLRELCDLQMPGLRHPLQGRSLAGTLCRNEPVGRTHCVSENYGQSSVIAERYKLGVWQKPESDLGPDSRAFGDMLFDRLNDPHEIHNLVGQSACKEIETELRGYLETWHASHPLPARLEFTRPKGA